MANDVNTAKTLILNMPVDEISKAFIEELFAGYHDKETNTFKEAPYEPNMHFNLTKQEYKYVNGTIDTTLGRLLMNRYLLERTGFIEHTGYFNEPLNDKNLSKLNTKINNIILMDKREVITLGDYIDARDRLGFWCSSFLAASVTEVLVRPMEDLKKRKQELFEEKHDKLHSQNPVEQIMAASDIEKELLDIAKTHIKDDPGYDMYASGVNNYSNNYKTVNVMRGAVYNGASKRYDIVENSLMDGITKKDITPFANSVVAAAYPSAVGTAEAGYMAKIILALLQSEKINTDRSSDCGTQSTIKVSITDKNKRYFLFRNIKHNGKLVPTTLENIDQFVGKTIELYSPQCCKDKDTCAKCAGELFYRLGATNIGILSTTFTDKLLNIKLKSKHDLSQNAGIIGTDIMFADKNDHCYIDNGIVKNKLKMRMFIPRLLEEMSGFYKEASTINCFGIFPVKFYDKSDKEVFSTLLTIPVLTSFNVYSDIQEDIDNYIVTYEPDSEIASVAIQKSVINPEYFINQVYLYSKSPQLPYNMMTELMFKCLTINGMDLQGPSLTYELIARRVCRSGQDSFAKEYGNNPNVDQLSYTKLRFREAVQTAGVLQGILFQDSAKSINKGLAQTLNGIEPTQTPLEKIIKA